MSVEATAGLAKKCGIEGTAKLSMQRRVVTLDEFVQKEEGRRADFAFGQNIFDLYRKLYMEEFRFEPAYERRLTFVEDNSEGSREGFVLR